MVKMDQYIIVSIAILSVVPAGLSCSCAQFPFKVSFCRSQFSFKGTILARKGPNENTQGESSVDITSYDISYGENYQSITSKVYYDIRIEKTFKDSLSGKEGTTITVSTGFSSALCGVPWLRLGTYYIEAFDITSLSYCDTIIDFNQVSEEALEWYSGNSCKVRNWDYFAFRYSSDWLNYDTFTNEWTTDTPTSTSDPFVCEKNGACNLDVQVECSVTNNECSSDTDCNGERRCCSDGCQMTCVYPIFPAEGPARIGDSWCEFDRCPVCEETLPSDWLNKFCASEYAVTFRIRIDGRARFLANYRQGNDIFGKIYMTMTFDQANCTCNLPRYGKFIALTNVVNVNLKQNSFVLNEKVLIFPYDKKTSQLLLNAVDVCRREQ